MYRNGSRTSTSSSLILFSIHTYIHTCIPTEYIRVHPRNKFSHLKYERRLPGIMLMQTSHLFMMADEKTPVVRKWKGWTTQDRRECQDDREEGRFLGLTLRLFFLVMMQWYVMSCHAMSCLVSGAQRGRMRGECA